MAPPKYRKEPLELKDFQLLRDYKPSMRGKGFHKAKKRYKYLVWGIKSGKTFAGSWEFCRKILLARKTRGFALGWVAAPTYKNTEEAKRYIMRILHSYDGPESNIAGANGAILYYNEKDGRVRLIDGTEIVFVTCEKYDNLRCANLDVLWMDEAAFIPRGAIKVLLGRLLATKGPIIATTSPNGRNHVWEWCMSAGMPSNGPYGTWNKGDRYASHYSTDAFPWVDADAIAELKTDLTRLEFEREVEAAFTGNEGAVFSHIEETFSEYPGIVRKKKSCKYCMGLDLGKHQDFTAIIVMDGNGHCVFAQQWNKLAWPVQYDRIEAIAREWEAAIIADVSNVGSAVCDELKARDLYVYEVNTNSAKIKAELIQALQMALNMKRIKMPRPDAKFATGVWAEIVRQLKEYEITITKKGSPSYSAPKGDHDDLVIALALAQWGKLRGLAGGSAEAAEAVAARIADEDAMRRRIDSKTRLRKLKNPARRLYSRRSSVGLHGSSRPFWGR